MTPDLWGRFLGDVTSIIVGSIPGVAAVLWFLLRMTRKMDIFIIEHEMLMSDYAKGKGISLKELPTRTRYR